MNITPEEKERLVKMAEDVIDNTSVPSSTQLQNLLMASKQASCIAELKNFIYYQTARKSGDTIEKDFGDELIKNLDTLNEEKDYKKKMAMVQYFFGYLKRYGYYKKS